MIKNQMARSRRYIIPDLPHHTIQRGNNRQNIFYDEGDKTYFLSKLEEIAKKAQVLIGSYCLMTNHIHLLLYPKDERGLIKVMKETSQYYSQYINRKHKRTGKFWENRYKLHIVDPESEWVIARYIESNPIRAEIVKRAEDYKYSSARANLLGEHNNLITKDIIKKDREGYRDFFHQLDAADPNHIRQINITVEQQKILGSDKFINWLENRLGACLRVRGRGRPSTKQPSKNK